MTTEACRRFLARGWDPAYDDAIRRALAELESATGKHLGSGDAPLLVSVRSGAPVSMPGMMDTVLNVGMGDTVEAALAAQTGDPAFAADTHRRFLVAYGSIVAGATDDVLAEAAELHEPAAVRAHLERSGIDVPTDPTDQVIAAIRAVFRSWEGERAAHYRAIEGIDASMGTAATVQAMVFGNLGDDSGTGVAFTRDPATGAPGLMGDFMVRAQGEDVVAGDHATSDLAALADRWPDLWTQLAELAEDLEHRHRDMMDIEFTIERGSLWLLQARVGKRSPIAAMRIAIAMAEDDGFPLDKAGAVRRCAAILDDPPLVTAHTDGASAGEDLPVIASGIAASPGTASGVLCTDVDEAVRLAGDGVDVVLAREQTSPADVHGMAAARAIFTTLGGKVSHAAVVARSWGIPAVVGAADADVSTDAVTGPGGRFEVGAVVTVDGDRGLLLAGGTTAGGTPAPEVLVLRRWADERPAEVTGAAAEPATGSVGQEKQMRSSNDFGVLHALRIKGMATADIVAAIAGVDEEVAEAVLGDLAAAGHARYLDKLSYWQITPEGGEAHAEALPARIEGLDLELLPYDRFLELNTDFKQLCTDWQLKDGAPNDHADTDYDRAVVARLVELDETSGVVIDEMAAVLEWLAPYRRRLAAALDRLRGGDTKALTGVMCDSYHDIWMELHEDLIITQGIDRVAEGSG